ncbi:Hsp20/alpha crystallin family protein [Pararhizobium sp. LjRoot235]|uniref:Hsp20/alpha crystallin family protein n=1 Tax=Pararhizobium sp. LjRoot235 TaxID=3342291 RepID=UPI003ED03B0C
MAKGETTKAGTKGESKQQSQAALTSQPELEGKRSAEQDAGERTHERPVFIPRVDIYETEHGLVVVADLPGVSPEGLEVTLEKRVLSIYGRVEEDAPEGYSQAYREYAVGDFERQFTLSGDFDINGIEANLKLGVLHLAIPRAPEAAAKRIEVRSVP